LKSFSDILVLLHRTRPPRFCGSKLRQNIKPMDTLTKDEATLEQAVELGLLPEEFEK